MLNIIVPSRYPKGLWADMNESTKISEHTKTIFTVLLRNLTKDELISVFISTIEAVGPTAADQSELINISVFVHSKEVLMGESSIEDFTSYSQQKEEK